MDFKIRESHLGEPTLADLIAAYQERFGKVPLMEYSDAGLMELIPRALETGEPIPPADEYFDEDHEIIR